MKKILKIKIITDEFQHKALLGTMNLFNEIQNEISSLAFENKEYRKYHVHQIVYKSLKQKYKQFSSQLIIRATDNVTNSYKTKRQKIANGFKKNGAVIYDDRIISFNNDTISIWTVNGRLKNIPIIIYNKELFNYRKGQVDLIYQNNKWFLLCTIDVPEPERYTPK